jgi:hypothetical protein
MRVVTDVGSGFSRIGQAWVIGLLALTVAACSGGPTPPSPPPPTPNALPVIASITASAERVEVTDEVTFTATVSDAETPLEQLTHQWTASAGSITGTGAVAKWRPPTTVPGATPHTVTLTVVERYQSGAQTAENRVSATSPQVQVLDSPKELSELALTFLRDFADSSVSPEQCVRNFSNTCSGKADELGDIQRNRAEFLNLDRKLGPPAVELNTDRTRATVIVRCEFLARNKATGLEGWAIGNCALTAVLEALKWWLCESRFHSVSAFDPRFIF